MTNNDENNQTTKLEENLTDEQSRKYKEQLIDYFSKINADNPDMILDYLNNTFNLDIPDMERPEKILACPHEIVITVIANVLEENEKGQLIGSKEICKKNYHIPVPSSKNYSVYMQSFFTHLEQCIVQSAKQSNQETETKNE